VTQQSGQSYDDLDELPGWARRGISFAAVMLILLGVFQAIAGLTALFDDRFFVVAENYVFDLDPTVWGWIHLALGIVMLAAGLGLMSGASWATGAAVFLVLLSAILNFFVIPYYPFWSLLLIALDIWVLFSLTRLALDEE
jgi:predicted Na+-dependent transporter